MARSNTTFLLILFVLFAFCLSGNGVYAFGAGNIPSFAYMEGRAFRHGDIEDVLSQLVKRASGGGAFAIASMLTKGHKFNGLDIKRVYFGNWLRDYSQAVDVGTLKKLEFQTIMNLVMVLSFVAHGYATHEFEVTPVRLGVYLPTEHIDNPKGYGEGEDARRYHPELRGPVDPRELEVDPETGMKNYIANERGSWDTSKGLVRRTLEKCIHLGRQNRANGQKQDEYEALRLLGQALHTLEDFSAHSNFCELALVSLGHQQVFVHVGDNVRVQAPNGRWVAPIVTGTFGSNDFIHSLLGEASDHLSSASVTDVNAELKKARSKAMTQTRGPGGPPVSPTDGLRDVLSSVPGGGGSEFSRDLDNIERIRAGPAAGGKRPEEMTPQELHAVLWQVLTFRDSVMKKISKTIEKIPGLGPLIDKIMDSLSVFVFTTLDPFLSPILKTATSGLQSASGEVIDTVDQYEVFNDPIASDPTHSFLSKDHFNLILNEPAGKLAQIIVVHTVKLITRAWDDNSVNVHQVTEEALQCLFHPDFHTPKSQVQREMMQCIKDWINKVPNQYSVIDRLSKNAVRNHKNIRLAGEGGPPESQGSFADGQAHQFQHTLQGYASNIPGVSQAQNLFGNSRDGPGGYGPPQTGPPPTGQAASYYSDNKPSTPGGYGGAPAYGPPPGGPPAAPHQHGGSPAAPHQYGGPPAAPHRYGSPPAAPHRYGSPPAAPHQYGGSPAAPHQHGSPPAPHRQHSGYAPTYTPPTQTPSFPSTTPGFPGGPDHGVSSPPPSFPGAAPSFPGGPGPSGYGPPPGPPGGGGYGPPHGPPPHGGAPSFPGGPGGFGAPPGSPPFGFPGADTDPYGAPSRRPTFPGAPGSGPSFPYGGSGGGW